MDTDTSWRQEWVIDPDPFAVAQARHLPTGFGMMLATIDVISVDPGERPFVAAYYADDSVDIAFQLSSAAGQQVNDWIGDKRLQALELWCDLGLDLDPAATPPDPPPCQVRSWRDEWTAQGDDGAGLPDLVHTSGLAVRHVYTNLDESHKGWTATVPAEWSDRVSAAETHLGKQKLARLRQEASILWMELGFFDCIPERVTRPFGDDWRTLWKVQEEPGEQWLVHVSGMAITPVYGTVDEDGTEAWSLHSKVFGFDSEIERKVGGKAWRRIHDQGWRLCVELGFVSEATDT